MPKRVSKISLLGDLPEVSWICYLLYGSHMGLSRGAPGRHQKSSPIPEPLPNPIFLHFKRIWGSIWEPIWHNFGSFLGVRFEGRFLDRFLENRGSESWHGGVLLEVRLGGGSFRNGRQPLGRILFGRYFPRQRPVNRLARRIIQQPAAHRHRAFLISRPGHQSIGRSVTQSASQSMDDSNISRNMDQVG